MTADPPLLNPGAHVHLMGICGVGMASLAGMFHESGYRVTGSDAGVYPPMSDFLHRLGIPIMDGYSASNLDPRPALIVVGNVIRRSNPEAIELERSGAPYVSMPDAIDRYFAAGRTRIVVTGTHGKTTVSSMIAWILFHADLDPGFMIGGILGNFESNFRLGRGDCFVVEGDEYDTAYFDKTPKFLHYRPHVGVLTSCEFDHGDIYGDLEQIKDRFRTFTELIPPDGRLVAYLDDPCVREIVDGHSGPLKTYGFGSAPDWRPDVEEESPAGMRVTIADGNGRRAGGLLPLSGRHNALNAAAAISAVDFLGVSPERSLDALACFKGVRRRQEIVGEAAGVTIVDDFAHHPTAVDTTCRGMKSRYPDRRLVAVFEPRTNTSKRALFQQAYAAAFGAADLAVIREPRDIESIPVVDRFSAETLARDLRTRGTEAAAFPTTDDILDFLEERLQNGDMVLIMSNGSFDNAAHRLLTRLKERRS